MGLKPATFQCTMGWRQLACYIVKFKLRDCGAIFHVDCRMLQN
jgi:hypothetical protein